MATYEEIQQKVIEISRKAAAEIFELVQQLEDRKLVCRLIAVHVPYAVYSSNVFCAYEQVKKVDNPNAQQLAKLAEQMSVGALINAAGWNARTTAVAALDVLERFGASMEQKEKALQSFSQEIRDESLQAHKEAILETLTKENP